MSMFYGDLSQTVNDAQINNKDLVQSEKPAMSMFAEEGTDVSVNNEGKPVQTGRPNISMLANEQFGGAWTESPDASYNGAEAVSIIGLNPYH